MVNGVSINTGKATLLELLLQGLDARYVKLSVEEQY
jgi:hypothetical protein